MAAGECGAERALGGQAGAGTFLDLFVWCICTFRPPPLSIMPVFQPVVPPFASRKFLFLHAMRLHTLAYLVASALVVPAALAGEPPGLITIVKDDENDEGLGYRDIVERPSGNLLATRGSGASVWDIDPNRKTRRYLFKIEGADYIEAITALPNEVYVFWAYRESAPVWPEVLDGVPGIWMVDLSGGDDREPDTEKVLPLLNAFGTHVGLAAWDDTRVVMCDTETASVRILDIKTRKLEVAIDTLNLERARAIHAQDNWVYVLTKGELHRIRVDSDARPLGNPETIAADLDLSRSFDVADDGTVYAVSYDSRAGEGKAGEGTVLRITADGAHVAIAGGPGTETFLHTAAARIGRTGGKTTTLYVTTMSARGKGNEGRIMAIENFKALTTVIAEDAGTVGM